MESDRGRWDDHGIPLERSSATIGCRMKSMRNMVHDVRGRGGGMKKVSKNTGVVSIMIA